MNLSHGRDHGRWPSPSNVYLGLNYPQAGVHPVSTPDGNVLDTFRPSSTIRGLAVDSAGRVYVATPSQTARLQPKGDFIRTVALGSSYRRSTGRTGQSNDDIYVDQGDRVLHFNSSGTVVGDSRGRQHRSGRSLAVDANHRLYLIEGGQGGKVHYYDLSPRARPSRRQPGGDPRRRATPGPATPKTSR